MLFGYLPLSNRCHRIPYFIQPLTQSRFGQFFQKLLNFILCVDRLSSGLKIFESRWFTFTFQQVYVRRPSGDVSWMCRVQNGSLNSDSVSEFPLADLTAIFQPSMEPMELQDLQTGATIDAEKLGEDGFISLMKSPAQVSWNYCQEVHSPPLIGYLGHSKFARIRHWTFNPTLKIYFNCFYFIFNPF